MENSQDVKRKNKSSTNICINETITELNKLIYDGAKLVCEEIGVPFKITDKKSKPGREIQLETLKGQEKWQKKKNAGICWDKKEKATQEKITIQLEEINQKYTSERMKITNKRYRERVKQYRHNRTFQNNKRKFYEQVREDDSKIYLQPDAREAEQFWSKIWQLR